MLLMLSIAPPDKEIEPLIQALVLAFTSYVLQNTGVPQAGATYGCRVRLM